MLIVFIILALSHHVPKNFKIIYKSLDEEIESIENIKIKKFLAVCGIPKEKKKFNKRRHFKI